MGAMDDLGRSDADRVPGRIRVGIALAMAVAVLPAASHAALIYEIDSGATQVDTVIDPLSTAETVASFYDYDPSGFSQIDWLLADTMHIFLHEDTSETCVASIGLAILFDDPASGSLLGGEATVDLSGAPGRATIDLYDDLSMGEPDTYPALGVNGQYYWDWSACCTDGVAIGNLGAQEWVIEISIPDLPETDDDLRRITNFAFLTGDPSSPTFLTLESLQSTSLFITARLDPVPEPSVAMLLGLGLATFGLVVRYERRD